MATKKTNPVKKTVTKAPVKKTVAKAPVMKGVVKDEKKEAVKKVTVSRAKPFTTQKPVVKHVKVQTAEGWKRSMMKLHKVKKAKTDVE